MTLSELTDTLQVWCNKGYSLQNVELKDSENEKSVLEVNNIKIYEKNGKIQIETC